MSELTNEEQEIAARAKAYHAEHGRELDIDYIVGHHIEGSDQNCLYMVMGYVSMMWLTAIETHQKSVCMHWLRVGHDFVPLEAGEVKMLRRDSIASLLLRFLEGDEA